MDLLISLLILAFALWLGLFLVDQIAPAPSKYNRPGKIIVAVIVLIYLLGYFAAGFPVWPLVRHR